MFFGKITYTCKFKYNSLIFRSTELFFNKIDKFVVHRTRTELKIYRQTKYLSKIIKGTVVHI